MAKGASIKFISYEQTVPQLLELLKIEKELKKHDKIVLKPYLKSKEQELEESQSTPVEFAEAILKFVIDKKNPVAQVFIAEGADGEDTNDLFSSLGYAKLAEKYSIGLIDLNNTEIEEKINDDFLKFSEVQYPRILSESFVISIPKLSEDDELGIISSLSIMLGAFPSQFYSGFFSSKKNRIRKWPIKYSIHDIIKCKLPEFAVIDASKKGAILAGLPLDMDKQSAKLLGLEWKNVPYIKLLDESFTKKETPEFQ